jgi:RNA polymerase sigma-70 factor (ECF subfamily)
MPGTAEEFASLLGRARQGDQAALADLVRQYEPRVRLVARVLLGPALRPYLDSLDLTQSVHRSLLLGLRQEKFDISGPEQLLALALTLVRRKAARQWRRLRRQQRLSGELPAASGLEDLLGSLSSWEADPAQAAQSHEQVHNLCRSLDAAERRLLELRLEGYSPAEMARQMGLHPVAVRVRLTRLRRRLGDSGILDEWL